MPSTKYASVLMRLDEESESEKFSLIDARSTKKAAVNSIQENKHNLLPGDVIIVVNMDYITMIEEKALSDDFYFVRDDYSIKRLPHTMSSRNWLSSYSGGSAVQLCSVVMASGMVGDLKKALTEYAVSMLRNNELTGTMEYDDIIEQIHQNVVLAYIAIAKKTSRVAFFGKMRSIFTFRRIMDSATKDR